MSVSRYPSFRLVHLFIKSSREFCVSRFSGSLLRGAPPFMNDLLAV